MKVESATTYSSGCETRSRFVATHSLETYLPTVSPAKGDAFRLSGRRGFSSPEC